MLPTFGRSVGNQRVKWGTNKTKQAENGRKEAKCMGIELSEAAKEARRAYYREYYQKHKEADRAKQAKFWERKGKELQADGVKSEPDQDTQEWRKPSLSRLEQRRRNAAFFMFRGFWK